MLKQEKIQHWLLLTLLFISGMFGVLLLSKYVVRPDAQNAKISPNQELTQAADASPSPQATIEFTDSKPIVSPDKKKTIIVRDYLDWKEIILRTEGEKEKIIEKVDGILVLTDSFLWSPNSSKVSYTTGTASLGHYVTVADLQTDQLTPLDGRRAFLDQVENDGNYDHIYTQAEEWRNTEEVVISVAGIHSLDDKKSQTMSFLMNVETGEVIKRLF